MRHPAEEPALRSVYVHLWQTSDVAVRSALNDLCVHEKDSWQARIDGDPYLYVDFYRDGPAEFEDWTARFASHGGPPDITVVADVSGRHDGWPQVQAFVVALLHRFPGVATDDDWIRLWQREEVAADLTIDNVQFGSWRQQNVNLSAAE